MFTLSHKTIKRPNSRALPNLSSLPPFLVCFKCCVGTKHTGGGWFWVMASESSSPQKYGKINHCRFIGWRHRCKLWRLLWCVCISESVALNVGVKLGRPSQSRRRVQPGIGHISRHATKHTSVQLARTISISRFQPIFLQYMHLMHICACKLCVCLPGSLF